jgi:hypothetical protein
MIETERSRFFDAGTELPYTVARPARYELERVIASVDGGPDREWFQLRRRIGYVDRTYGELVVPADLGGFYSDLTSVPALFTWLVPKSGDHLPAALIHDGLVRKAGRPPEHIGVDIGRVDADRVLRDAMADSGTGVVRRWIVWTAVTLATMWAMQGTAAGARLRAYYRWVMVVSLFSIAWLGYEATADLVNRTGRWPCTYELFWIVGESGWEQLLSGAAGAIAIPLLLSVAWFRFWKAGAIAGVLLGALFHVSLALLVLSGAYVLLEAAVTDRWSGVKALAARVWGRRTELLWASAAAGGLVVVCLLVD